MSTSTSQLESNIAKPPTKPMTITIADNDIYVEENMISINPDYSDFDNPNLKSITIDSSNYSKLFEKDCERFHIKGLDVPQKPSLKLIYIACQKFARSNDEDMYAIIIDPSIPKVVSSESVWHGFFGPGVYVNDTCTSCIFPIYEFKEYDPTQQQFVLTNNKHKIDFTELLETYEAMNNKDLCVIAGKQMTLNEALKSSSDDSKCADNSMIQPDSIPDYFITIGQYRDIIQKIRRVINGENIKIYDFSQI